MSKSIANLLVNEGQIIPIISKVEGGTKDKPELGVFASARTEAITF